MPNGKQAEQVQAARKRRAQDRNRMSVEPSPSSPGEVIDPRDPQAQRRFQVQQRGGAYSDRVKIDPFAKGYKWPVERKPVSRG